MLLAWLPYRCIRESPGLRLSVAISPCPNDTFLFHALATGKVAVPGYETEFHYHDVEELNRRAACGEFEITKLSFHAWLKLREEYSLLRSGAAIGFGCGPVVAGRDALTRDDLRTARIVVPGELTTGNLLFRLWAPDAAPTTSIPYDRILGMILEGEADCGVIIHESRFVFEDAGLTSIRDLGEWWEEATGLPIPLGCIAVRSDLPLELNRQLESAIRESLEHARRNREEAMEFARGHACELDADVLSRHVDMFVNDFSLDLGDEGLAAVEQLEIRAKEAGVL